METDDCPELFDANAEDGNVFLSKLELVGELRPCCANDGKSVVDLDVPPPPLLPPPPPWIAVVEAAAEVARFELEKGVLARERGDDSN